MLDDVLGRVRVGACQTPEILGDAESALSCVEDFAAQAEGVDLLVFPECFLQGYLVEADHLRRHAVDRCSGEFGSVVPGEARFDRGDAYPSPRGEAVAQVPLVTTGMAVADIDSLVPP